MAEDEGFGSSRLLSTRVRDAAAMRILRRNHTVEAPQIYRADSIAFN